MRFSTSTLLLALVLLFPPLAMAVPAGNVLLVVGEAGVIREGTEIPLGRGAFVESGDTLYTRANSRLQVRMTDHALIALREQSQFRIDDYRFKDEQGDADKAFYSLLKGGFRTISGLIGKGDTEAYRATSAMGVLGIRGTHYAVRLCQGDCVRKKGGAVPDGLYGGVFEGGVEVRTDAGAVTFARDQFFFVAGMQSLPQLLLGPPDILKERLEDHARTKGDQGEEGNGRRRSGKNPDQAQETATEGDSAQGEETGFSANMTETEGADTSVGDGRQELDFNAGDLSAPSYVAAEETGTSGVSEVLEPGLPADEPTTAGTNTVILAYAAQDANYAFALDDFDTWSYTELNDQLVDYNAGDSFQGYVGPTGASQTASTTNGDAAWGRWNMPAVSGPYDSGSSMPPTGVHYMLLDATPAADIAQRVGTVALTHAGGTPPSDSLGNLGSFDSNSTLSVNFTTQQVAGHFGWTVAGETYDYTFARTPIVASGVGAGFYLSGEDVGTCTSCIGGIDYLNGRGTFIGSGGTGVAVGISTFDFAPAAHGTASVQLFRQ